MTLPLTARTSNNTHAGASPAFTAADVAAARRRIAAAQRALLVTHISPDGDAIGSVLGFGLALRAAGKTAVMACDDGTPDTFRFLTGADEITADPRGQFDLIVSLDAADLKRLGAVGEKLPRRPDLLFDHHITNPGFADINLIDVSAASTAELIAEWIDDLGLPLTASVAECLLTGLIADTQGFRTSNTSPKTLALAQKLMKAGAPLSEIYNQALHKRSIAALRLWAGGLATLKLEDRVAWAVLTQEARQAAKFPGQGDADLADLLTSIREADVAVVLIERADGKVKISWRAVPGINVSDLAASFGGGGHAPAAGAEIAGTLAEVEATVIAVTKALLKVKRETEPKAPYG
jgi:phosphoesterase RecJ-like protein